MKTIIIIVSIIVLLAIWLFPKVEVYEDGGTKTYSAFLYKYIKWQKMVDCDRYVKPYYKESELIFFPNNFKNLDSYWKEENLKKIPKYKPFSNKNTEKNINISKKENSETQKIVEDFTLKLWKEKNNVKQWIFNWNTEDWVREIKWFIIKDKQSEKDNYEIAEELFKDWKQNIMSVADGPWTSIVWYQKENVVCTIKSEMNATIEQINTMENPASLWYAFTISCGKYQEKKWKTWKEIWTWQDINETICKDIEFNHEELINWSMFADCLELYWAG